MRHPCRLFGAGSAGSHRLARCPLKRLLDPHNGADRWDDMIVYGDAERAKLVGKFSMFVGGEAPILADLDVLQTVVHGGGLAIE